jgi:hypothetical protein
MVLNRAYKSKPQVQHDKKADIAHMHIDTPEAYNSSIMFLEALVNKRRKACDKHIKCYIDKERFFEFPGYAVKVTQHR